MYWLPCSGTCLSVVPRNAHGEITTIYAHNRVNGTTTVPQSFLNVFGVRLYLIYQTGIDLTQDDTAIVFVDEELDKLLAIQAQLGAQAIDALIHTIVWMMPEGIYNLLYALMTGRDGNAFPKHKRGC